ncbi:lytic transglycosylase domain-containing protein [Streptomyces rishiriensis]|uniref:Transglycosylase SLT domain-containing protein n=1 Tax=Streptomyces rishiriensis TaxID=68264 RepID=A0ABU0NGD8_STRRH|nr:lytic transglycosylase domain-containing protein [Streptomyces rishiriensis]MDQ0578176.1 hypothetical protein [Streptomyces rishiriensis]
MAGESSATKMAVAAVGGFGCLAAPVGVALVTGVLILVGGLGVLLFPLVIIYMFFHGLSFSGLGSVGDLNSGLSDAEQRCETSERANLESDSQSAADRASRIITGDGLGKLEVTLSNGAEYAGGEPCTVPPDLYSVINSAGEVCDAIGPVVIAAQIQYESGFDSKFVGPNGAKGISQVPGDVFKRFQGEDADPFEPKESIAAQGKYLCDLSKQIGEMLERNELTGNLLDLTLTAYDVGIGTVRTAQAVPATNESQSYITGVRTWFATMEGVGPPPRKLAGVPGLRDDGGQSGPAAEPVPEPELQ